jgi:hypothetical protein
MANNDKADSGKVPTPEQIRALLSAGDERSDRAVEEALLRLHARQTTDEQRARDTKYRNNRGFSAAHARKGSKFASWITDMRRDGAVPGKAFRSRAKLEEARALALHYVGQLHEEAVAKFESKRSSEPPAAGVAEPLPQVFAHGLDPKTGNCRCGEMWLRDDGECETVIVQRNDRIDSERAARAKLYHDRRLALSGQKPGTLIKLDSTDPPFGYRVMTDVALREPVQPTRFDGIVLEVSRLRDGTAVSRVALGSSVLWFRVADICTE